MNILVSACLLGVCCRYDGSAVNDLEIKRKIGLILLNHRIVPVCPEQLGGLATPREPAEIRGGNVVKRDGGDVTLQYKRGALEVLRLAQLFDCRVAILKERSPSCGFGRIYDGSFSGVLTDGDGVTAGLLRENGIIVYGESEIDIFTESCSSPDSTQ